MRKGEELRARPCGGPEVHIVLSFPFAPLPLSENYVEDFERRNGGNIEDSYRVIDHAERLQLWGQFCDAAQARILSAHPSVRVVDVRDEFLAPGGFAKYCVAHEEDHHPDLAKSQHAVAARIEKLRFAAADGTALNLEPKLWPHKEMYPHVRRRFTSPSTRPSTKPSPSPSTAPSLAASLTSSPVLASQPALVLQEREPTSWQLPRPMQPSACPKQQQPPPPQQHYAATEASENLTTLMKLGRSNSPGSIIELPQQAAKPPKSLQSCQPSTRAPMQIVSVNVGAARHGV